MTIDKLYSELKTREFSTDFKLIDMKLTSECLNQNITKDKLDLDKLAE